MNKIKKTLGSDEEDMYVAPRKNLIDIIKQLALPEKLVRETVYRIHLEQVKSEEFALIDYDPLNCCHMLMYPIREARILSNIVRGARVHLEYHHKHEGYITQGEYRLDEYAKNWIMVPTKFLYLLTEEVNFPVVIHN